MNDIFEIDGAKFIAKDDMIVSWVRKECREFEPKTRDWIFQNIPQGGLFVDVGASTGWYSVALALAGIEVLAIEPNKNVIDRLKKNIDLNGVGGMIEIVPGAAGDVSGFATLYINPLVPLTSGASLDPKIRSRANRLRASVPVDTIDNLVGDRRVAMMKVDVEGFELQVLRGSSKVLERDRPPMILEANNDDAARDLRDFLCARNYSVSLADERNLLCLPMS